MRPIWWLLIAEIAMFYIATVNIIQGISFLLLPEYAVSYFIIFAMFVSWFLDKTITWILYTNKVTVDDLLGKQ
jgi:hypothetical protein